MKQAKLLLSFDIEEFDLPQEFHTDVPEDEKFSVSADGTRAILDLMAETGIRATFFITGRFAERYPEMIREMAAAGHEIASHGLDHSSFAVSHLERSRHILESVSGQKVVGFRMARLAKVEKLEIMKAGYLYESSLNPVWLPGRYSNAGKPLLPFREQCGLWQIPVSAVPLIRFPLFWLSFKNLPLFLYRSLTAVAVRSTGFFNMYSHPWEYNAAAADPRWKIPGYIVRHAGNEQTARLRDLILFLKRRGEFITFREFLSTLG